MEKKTDMEKLTLKAGRFIPMPGGEQLAGRVSRAEDYLTAMSGELEDLLDRISLLLRCTESRITRLEDGITRLEDGITRVEDWIARVEDRIARVEDTLAALHTMADTPTETSASTIAVRKGGGA